MFTLDTEGVSANYNPQSGIAFFTYRGILTPEVTARAYAFTAEVMDAEIDKVLGAIYDFREVTAIDNRNLTSAQRQSQSLNRQYDMNHIPVALIANDAYQAQLLGISVKLSPQQERKRVVHSLEDALAFVKAWHETR